MSRLMFSSKPLQQSAGLIFLGGAEYQLVGSTLLKTALQVGTTKNVDGQTYVLNQNHRWTRKVQEAAAQAGQAVSGKAKQVKQAAQNVKQNAGKIGHAVVHEGDHLGQNVAAWKSGQVIGGAIASYAIAHGANPVAATIISQSVVQAGTATALYVAQRKNKGKPAQPKEVANQFVQQVAGAYLGKYAHHGTEWALENLGVKHLYEQVGAMVAGKVTGIKTTQEVGRMHLDSRVTMAAIGAAGLTGKHLSAFAQHFGKSMGKRQGMVFKSADGAIPPEISDTYWKLHQAGVAIALHNQSQKKLAKSAESIKRVMPWWGLEIGLEKEPGDMRHGKPMKASYGHIRGSYGDAVDGMSLDVYIGPDLGSRQLFRVEQINPETGELDEHKYIIGCWSKDEAKKLYLAHIPKKYFGDIKKVGLRSLVKYRRNRLAKSSKNSPGQMSLFGADGPKEGDTKPGAHGNTLTLRNGRWRDEDASRVTQPKQVLGVIQEDPSREEQADAIYSALENAFQALFQSQREKLVEEAFLDPGEIEPDKATAQKIRQMAAEAASQVRKAHGDAEIAAFGIDIESEAEGIAEDAISDLGSDVDGNWSNIYDNLGEIIKAEIDKQDIATQAYIDGEELDQTTTTRIDQIIDQAVDQFKQSYGRNLSKQFDEKLLETSAEHAEEILGELFDEVNSDWDALADEVNDAIDDEVEKNMPEIAAQAYLLDDDEVDPATFQRIQQLADKVVDRYKQSHGNKMVGESGRNIADSAAQHAEDIGYDLGERMNAVMEKLDTQAALTVRKRFDEQREQFAEDIFSLPFEFDPSTPAPKKPEPLSEQFFEDFYLDPVTTQRLKDLATNAIAEAKSNAPAGYANLLSKYSWKGVGEMLESISIDDLQADLDYEPYSSLRSLVQWAGGVQNSEVLAMPLEDIQQRLGQLKSLKTDGRLGEFESAEELDTAIADYEFAATPKVQTFIDMVREKKAQAEKLTKTAMIGGVEVKPMQFVKIGGIAYVPMLKSTGIVLVKASKKSSPGQMSLFGDGPKDGDTKPGANSNTLTFRDGRWHDESTKGTGGQDASKQVLASISDNHPAAKLPQAMRNTDAALKDMKEVANRTRDNQPKESQSDQTSKELSQTVPALMDSMKKTDAALSDLKESVPGASSQPKLSRAQQLKTVDPKHLSETTKKAFQILDQIDVQKVLTDHAYADWERRLETPEQTDEPAPYSPTEDAKKVLLALKQSPTPEWAAEQMMPENWSMSALKTEIKDANLYIEALDRYGVEDLGDLYDVTVEDVSKGKNLNVPGAREIYEQSQKYADPLLAAEAVAEGMSVPELKEWANDTRVDGEEEIAAMYEAIATDKEFRKAGKRFANFDPDSLNVSGDHENRQDAINTLNQMAIASHPTLRKLGAFLSDDLGETERVFDWIFEEIDKG